MFRNLFPIFFDGSDDGGSGAPAADPTPAADPAPVADPTPEPTDPAPAADPADPELEGDPTPDPEPVDYEARIGEWGGIEDVEAAVELQRALGTQEGVRALFEEAGAALKLSPDKIAELLGVPAPAEPADPIAELLGEDPDRLMSAKEVADLVQTVLDREVKQPMKEQQRNQFQDTVRSNVQTALTSVLGDQYDDDIASTICNLGEQFVTSDADLADPEKVKAAITRGKALFDAQVEKAHAQYVSEKKGAHEKLPKPLADGSPPGGENPTEPKNVAEASTRARARIAAALGNPTG